MRYLRLPLLFAVLFATGCATTVEFDVTRAPKLQLNNVEKVKLQRFRVEGSTSLSLPTSDNKDHDLAAYVIDAVAKDIVERNDPMRKDNERAIGDEVERSMVLYVSRSGYYRMVNGNNYDALIRGEVRYEVRDTDGWQTQEDDKGKKTEYYTIDREATIAIDIYAEDGSGNIVASSVVTADAKHDATGANYEEARIAIKDWGDLVMEALHKARPSLKAQLVPYKLRVRRTLKEGDDNDDLEEGNDEADDGNWRVATAIWNRVAQRGKSEDKAAAHYNIAVYHERRSELPMALEHYQIANELMGGMEYLHEIEDVRSLMDEIEQMKEQKDRVAGS